MFHDFFTPRIAGDLFGDVERLFQSLHRASSQASLNVWTDDQHLVVSTELPGVRREDVEVSTVGDTLTIRGARDLAARDSGKQTSERSDDAGMTWLRRERRDHAVHRTIQLPFHVDAERTQARLRDGVLTVILARAAADRPRAVTVQAA